MLGNNSVASREMIERLYGGLCSFQDLRAKYRSQASRTVPPTATAQATPPGATVPEPTTPPPPPMPPRTADVAAGPCPPAGPGDRSGDIVIVGYRSVKGQMLPIYGEPGDVTPHPTTTAVKPPVGDEPGCAPSASAATASTPAPPATMPGVPPSPRAPSAPPTLSLDPPTPPPSVRVDAQSASFERLLAEHRGLLAEQMEAAERRQAEVLRDVLAEHRRALAEANDQHRQQLSEIVAQLRTILHDGVTRASDGPSSDLHALLAEQARVVKAVHEQSTEQNASLAEMIAGLGETVNRLAINQLQPRAPLFSPPPRAVAVSGDANRASTEGSVVAAVDVPAASKTNTSAAPGAGHLPSRIATTRIPEPDATTATPAETPCHVTTRRGDSTGVRESPASSKPLSIVPDATPQLLRPPPTPRQLRAQEDEQIRSRIDDLVGECAEDDDFLSGVIDPDDEQAAPGARHV